MAKRIAVMCSGGGTNFQTLIDGCNDGLINGSIAVMISTSPKAYAIERAKQNRIPYVVIPKSHYATKEELDRARHGALLACAPDLIVLCGYLGILPEITIKMFPGRVINTHPALIPAFCGKGMYGENVHRAVLDYGVKLSGATIHFANEEIDGGPIILQKAVEVQGGDTVETLAARVLKVEHELLPKAVSLFCDDKLKISGRRVTIVE